MRGATKAFVRRQLHKNNSVMLKQRIFEVKKITGDIRTWQEEKSFFLDVIPLAFQYL